MCSMNTDAMNNRDITNTGTGPLKTNRNIYINYISVWTVDQFKTLPAQNHSLFLLFL